MGTHQGAGGWRGSTHSIKTALWVSHIVVLHRNSDVREPFLRPPGWAPDPPLPTRSEAEALARALNIAQLAAEAPHTFEQLAKTYSEDVVTKDSGGSLGGARAIQMPREYLDALVLLKPGQVSRVIRTTMGYHVIKRRPVPDQAQVAGQRIVIRYRGTYGGPAGVESERTRDAAYRLAAEIAERARSGKASFDALVEQYSDNADRVQAGDMGVWSVRDPGYLSREIERLAALKVGQIADPIDSVAGFQILKRTEVTPRPRYAMTEVAIPFDPKLPEADKGSRASARRLAKRLAAEIAKEPSRFEPLQDEHCCVRVREWSAGRVPIGVTPVLDQLKFGQIAKQPVESESLYVIAKRLDPAAHPDPEPSYELPNPRGPDFEGIVEHSDSAALAHLTRTLAADAKKALALAPEPARALSELLDKLARDFEATAPGSAARNERMKSAFLQIRAALGPNEYEKFDRFLNEWGTRLVLSQGVAAVEPKR